MSGVRLKGRDCRMTASSGLCWSVGTSQHHKANLSSKMSKGLLAFTFTCQPGSNQEHYCTAGLGLLMQRRWQMRYGSRGAWPEGQNTGKRARALGRLAKTDIASIVGRLTNATGLVRVGNHRELTDHQSLKACTIRISCPTAMNLRHAW